MSGTAPYTVNPRSRLEGGVSIFRNSQRTYSACLLSYSNLRSLVSPSLLLRDLGITKLPAGESHFSSGPQLCRGRSSILPHPQPLAPLLNHTPSPTSTFSLPIFPSKHNPPSRAHLLVVPRFPPERSVGVTHLSPRQKYGVVILPSIISPSWLASKISSNDELEAEGGRRERAVM